MRIIIQRVASAAVEVATNKVGSIAAGMLVLVGFCDADTADDLDYITKKITSLRIFNDAKGVPNLSILETKLALLLVSQFTLYATTSKGNRPSYIAAARPEVALNLYNQLIIKLNEALTYDIACGIFGSSMQVHLINDGPFTICIDSKNK